MTITLNGTGTVTGANTLTNTNTVTSATATALTLQSAGTTAIYVDTSQNVGIGTSSPTSRLDVQAAQTVLGLTSTTGTNAVYSSYKNNGGSTAFYIGIDNSTGSNFTGTGYAPFLWSQNAYPIIFGTSNAERARIDSSGNLLVGGTGVIYYSKVLSQFDGNSKYGYTANDTSGGANIGFMAFSVNGTATTGAIGTITRNGSSSAVLYNTTSDQRLKENITDADNALDIVNTIKVRKYDWKEGGQHEDYGFIAQELAEVVNNIVSRGKTEEEMWAVDYGKLTPLLCKAIQEQQTLITALTARITALEAK